MLNMLHPCALKFWQHLFYLDFLTRSSLTRRIVELDRYAPMARFVTVRLLLYTAVFSTVRSSKWGHIHIHIQALK